MKSTKVYYKYLTSERFTFLTDGLLRFSQPKVLNDSFECLPIMSSLEQFFSDREMPSYIPQTKPLTIDEIKERRIFDEMHPTTEMESRGFGILSLSKRFDSEVMWSHYTKYSGYVVGFNMNHSFFKSNDFLMQSVRYSNKRVEFQINDKELDIYFTKSKDWKYENEFRIISQFKNSTKVIESNYSIFLFEIPFEAVSEIIVGINADIPNIEIAKEFADKYSIPLYIAKQSYSNYLIEKERIF